MKNAFLLKLLEPLATLASGIGKRKKLFILIYHRVLDEPDFMRPDEVDKEAFTWQMELLAKHFNVLPLAEALERMQSDTLPPRAVCVTFDDGYADNYTNALPILQKFGLTATFFIASGFLDGGRMWNDSVIEAVRNFDGTVLDLSEIGLGLFDTADADRKCQSAQEIIQQIKHQSFEERSRCIDFIVTKSQNLPNDLMMSSEELKKIHQSGMEIGGHTVNHPILAKLDEQAGSREISDNKAFLEQWLGTKVIYFAYPNGKPETDYLPLHVDWVKKAGFHA
ncbi:MAG: polysaccharide deacetylase family protein, partial [Methylomonas sp.]|nr:polysaccharide deacetylase family protein [Methylomonas sp.]